MNTVDFLFDKISTDSTDIFPILYCYFSLNDV